MEPTVTVPAVRSAALASQISGTGKGIEVGDAYATRAPDSEDDDPSDVPRLNQARPERDPACQLAGTDRTLRMMEDEWLLTRIPWLGYYVNHG
jgi:hypothetical protein